MRRDRKLSEKIQASIMGTITALLKDFGVAMASGDRRMACITSARLSQFGCSVFEIFGSGSEALCMTHQDKDACRQAAVVMRELMERNLESWYVDSLPEQEESRLRMN